MGNNWHLKSEPIPAVPIESEPEPIKSKPKRRKEEEIIEPRTEKPIDPEPIGDSIDDIGSGSEND